MELVTVFFASIGSIIVLFLLAKLIGNKEMSQMTLFDYINGITIGSIAAEMATSLEDDFLRPLLAMVIYAVVVLFMTWLTQKSIKARRLIVGKSIILYDNNKLYAGNIKKGKIDLTDVLTQCRSRGYFDLTQIQTIILESNGQMSILPKSNFRSATPQDLEIETEPDKPTVNVILDGKILEDNLKYSGNNKIWLQHQLKTQGIRKIEDVFLAMCDYKNNLTVYKKIIQPMTRDMFQ